MRLWSISPKYLDTKGLLALWRESLLAKKVLEGKTKGYKNHPQLIRFKKSSDPLLYMNIYLKQIYDEAKKRGYKFDYSKIDNEKIKNLEIYKFEKINVTKGQIKYEFEFLKSKLKKRDFQKYLELENINKNTDNNNDKDNVKEICKSNDKDIVRMIYKSIDNEKDIEVNPIFEVIEGKVEEWEKTKIFE